jgi:hypothetical protein
MINPNIKEFTLQNEEFFKSCFKTEPVKSSIDIRKVGEEERKLDPTDESFNSSDGNSFGSWMNKIEGIKIDDKDFGQFIEELKKENIELNRSDMKLFKKFASHYWQLKNKLDTVNSKELKTKVLDTLEELKGTNLA